MPLQASVVFRHNNKRTEDKLKSREFSGNMGSSGNLMVDSDICWNKNLYSADTCVIVCKHIIEMPLPAVLF